MVTLSHPIPTARLLVFRSAVDAQPSASFRPSTAQASAPRRSGAQRAVDGLKTQLGITARQAEAWTGFADTLWANAGRMRDMGAADQPFGALQDRLAALADMRRATAELFAVLSPVQRHRAQKLLPLCCLPAAGSA